LKGTYSLVNHEYFMTISSLLNTRTQNTDLLFHR